MKAYSVYYHMFYYTCISFRETVGHQLTDLLLPLVANVAKIKQHRHCRHLRLTEQIISPFLSLSTFYNVVVMGIRHFCLTNTTTVYEVFIGNHLWDGCGSGGKVVIHQLHGWWFDWNIFDMTLLPW